MNLEEDDLMAHVLAITVGVTQTSPMKEGLFHSTT
jgi:hypothetical protein